MHQTSYDRMSEFVDKYLSGKKKLNVLDIGSMNVNGTYKPLFKDHQYIGADIDIGDNVDLIMHDIRPNVWDVVISGQCAEHVKDIYAWFKKIAVFLDGCFWHQCPTCFTKPKSNKKYWNQKIRKNIDRDLNTDIFLEENGIHVLRLWEHEINNEIGTCYAKLKKLIT